MAHEQRINSIDEKYVNLGKLGWRKATWEGAVAGAGGSDGGGQGEPRQSAHTHPHGQIAGILQVGPSHVHWARGEGFGHGLERDKGTLALQVGWAGSQAARAGH